ncbi:MAG: hypothetical protein ACXIU8_02830 [Alkalilacustris sp.]
MSVRPALLTPVLALWMAVWGAAAATQPLGPPLSPEAFEAQVTGHTFDFLLGGAPYGTEQYLPGRRVIWAFTDGPCREGSWFPRDDRICFEYDDEPGRLHCWSFHDTPEGLAARSLGMGDDGVVIMRRRAGPMSCPGPEVGV